MCAIDAIGTAVRRQAFPLAHSDCFVVLGCVLLASAVFVLYEKDENFPAQ
jgi:DHA2 family multidrug resistance protein